MAGITSNVKPHPEWRYLIEKFSGLDYGTRITHEEISSAISVKYGTGRYYQQVQIWKRNMRREYHKSVRVLNGIGYEIVKPDECTSHSRKRFLSGRRRTKEAAEIAAVAPMDRMSPVQAAKHATYQAWLSPLMKVLNKIEANTRPATLGRKRPDFPKLVSGDD